MFQVFAEQQTFPEQFLLIADSKPAPLEKTAGKSSSLAAKMTFTEPPPGTENLVAEAQRAFAARRLEEAEKKYLQVLARDETNVFTLTNLGAIRLELNKLDEAEQSLKAALATAPDDAFALSLFGLLKFRQEKYDDAIKSLRRSTEIDAANPSAFNYLGLALAQKDQPKEAENAFRKAIQLAPNFAGAHHNLAVFYGTRKPPSLGLAQWHYDKALGYGHQKNADLEKILSGN